MGWELIRKDGRKGDFNLADYDAAVREFSWQRARVRLDGLPGGRGLNIAYEAVDRHAAGPARRRGGPALCGQGRRRQRAHLCRPRPADRAGSPTCCATSGVGQGDRVFSLLGRVPELYVAALGTLKNTSVFSPAVLRVRPGADPGAAAARRRAGAGDQPRAVPAQGGADPRLGCPALRARADRRASRRDAGHDRAGATRSLAASDGLRRSRPPTPRTWRCCTSPAAPPASPRARSTCTRRSSPTTPPRRSRSTCARTTSSGAPPTPAGSPARRTASSRRSPSAPRCSIDAGEFDARRWYRHPRRAAGHGLVHRADRAADADAARRRAGRRATTCPRCGSSPASASRSTRRWCVWGEEALGRPVHDNWWQTETGAIMISNFAAMDIRPGLDGPAAAGRRGGRAASAARTAGRR